jgi:hypothetical protein
LEAERQATARKRDDVRTIWKYELKVTDVQHVEMPAEWIPTLWALVDPDAPMVRRLIAVVVTGNPVFDGGEVT